jgi:DHA1 family tetracycline resistance protein-like MFS transporter
MGAQGAGWVLALVGLVMALVQGGLVGRLSRRWSEPRLVAIGTFAMSVAFAMVALSHPLGPAVAGMVLLAFGNGLNSPCLSSLASKGARPERRGAVMGVYQAAGSLARAVGPPTAGWIYDRLGPNMPFLAGAALMLAASLAAVAWRGGTVAAMNPVESL